jgi:hypothetical protein
MQEVLQKLHEKDFKIRKLQTIIRYQERLHTEAKYKTRLQLGHRNI